MESGTAECELVVVYITGTDTSSRCKQQDSRSRIPTIFSSKHKH